MNTPFRPSFFSRLSLAALAVTLMLSAYRPATAQYIYYPNHATINTAKSADTAIVGFPNFADWQAGTHGTSPTISVTAGAKLSALQAYNHSVVTVSGGTISGPGLFALGNSTINISGGTVSEAMTWDNGTINVYAGANIPGAVWAQYGGIVNVYGGSIGSPGIDAFAQGAGNTLNISGGTFVSKQIWVDQGATLTISGGIGFRIIGYTYFNGVRTPIYGQVRYVVTATLVSSYATLTYNGSTTSGWSEYKLSGQLGDGTNVTGVKVYVSNFGATFTVSNPPLF